MSLSNSEPAFKVSTYSGAETPNQRSWSALPHCFQSDPDSLVLRVDPDDELVRPFQDSRPGQSLELATQLREARCPEGGPVGLQRMRRSSDFVGLAVLQPSPRGLDQPGRVAQERVDERREKTTVVSDGLHEALQRRRMKHPSNSRLPLPLPRWWPLNALAGFVCWSRVL